MAAKAKRVADGVVHFHVYALALHVIQIAALARGLQTYGGMYVSLLEMCIRDSRSEGGKIGEGSGVKLACKPFSLSIFPSDGHPMLLDRFSGQEDSPLNHRDQTDISEFRCV